MPADVWAALENYAAAGGSLLLGRRRATLRQRLPLLEPEPEREAWNAYGFGYVYLCRVRCVGLWQARLLSVAEQQAGSSWSPSALRRAGRTTASP